MSRGKRYVWGAKHTEDSERIYHGVFDNETTIFYPFGWVGGGDSYMDHRWTPEFKAQKLAEFHGGAHAYRGHYINPDFSTFYKEETNYV